VGLYIPFLIVYVHCQRYISQPRKNKCAGTSSRSIKRSSKIICHATEHVQDNRPLYVSFREVYIVLESHTCAPVDTLLSSHGWHKISQPIAHPIKVHLCRCNASCASALHLIKIIALPIQVSFSPIHLRIFYTSHSFPPIPPPQAHTFAPLSPPPFSYSHSIFSPTTPVFHHRHIIGTTLLL
jgi:hypothetical protein